MLEVILSKGSDYNEDRILIAATELLESTNITASDLRN